MDTFVLYDEPLEEPAPSLLAKRVTELIDQRRQDLGLTKTELAKRMGVGRTRVQKILLGDQNLTLRTVEDALAAMGSELIVQVAALEKGAR